MAKKTDAPDVVEAAPAAAPDTVEVTNYSRLAINLESGTIPPGEKGLATAREFANFQASHFTDPDPI